MLSRALHRELAQLSELSRELAQLSRLYPRLRLSKGCFRNSSPAGPMWDR